MEDEIHIVSFFVDPVWVPESWHEDGTEACRRAGFLLEHEHDKVKVRFSDGSTLEDTWIPEE